MLLSFHIFFSLRVGLPFFCKRLYVEGYLDNNDFLESGPWALHGNHVKARDDFSSNIKDRPTARLNLVHT